MSLKRARYTSGIPLGYSPSGRRRSGPLVHARIATKRRRLFLPGKDRVGGYYGRYAGSAGELKFHDVDLNDAVIAAGAQITDSINKIAQGVTESTRVGRKCTIKRISWRYRMFLPEQDAVPTPFAGDNVRVIMYQDKQCNGATIVALDLLETDDEHSFYNLANSGRFRILMDKTITLNYTGLASDNAGVVSQTRYSMEGTFNKACNIPIEFNNTTGAITEIRSNNIGVMLIGVTAVAVFDSKIRLRFSDT